MQADQEEEDRPRDVCKAGRDDSKPFEQEHQRDEGDQEGNHLMMRATAAAAPSTFFHKKRVNGLILTSIDPEHLFVKASYASSADYSIIRRGVSHVLGAMYVSSSAGVFEFYQRSFGE